MALRNRSLQEEAKLRGADRSRDSTKFKLGQFRTLQNWIPAHVYSIKKKRGVELLATDPLSPPTPTPCGCPPGTLPIAQDIPFVCCWNFDMFGDLLGNQAGMFAHVAADGSFIATAAESSGFGSGPYPITVPTRTWYVLECLPNCTYNETTAVPLLGYTADIEATQPAQAGLCGKSDERSYFLRLMTLTPPLPGTANVYTYFSIDASTFTFIIGCGATTWCKFDDRFYSTRRNVAFSGIDHIALWDAVAGGVHTTSVATGTVTGTANWDTTVELGAIHATANYAYLLNFGGPFATPTITRINKTTLLPVDQWALTSPEFASALSIHVVNDDLIFVATAPGVVGLAGFGYFIPSTSTEFFIGSLSVNTPECVFWTGLPSGQNGFYYRRGYFYVTTGGAVSGTTNVAKVGPLVCPGTDTVINLGD
jgi:hypothetical protein